MNIVEKLRLCNTNSDTEAADEIEALRAQVAALAKERDKLKTVPMKYRRMEFNAQLQNELAASQARERRCCGMR